MTSVSPTGFSTWQTYIRDYVRTVDLVALTSALTLALVVFFGFHEHWLTRIVTNFALVAVLLFPGVIYRHVFWLILAVTSTYALTQDWYTADNHKYLFVYWLYVMWVCQLQPSHEEKKNILIWHARFFLIFIFLAAAARKFSNPTYMSGEMFGVVLFIDERFKAFAHLMGVSATAVEEAFRSAIMFRSPLSEFPDNKLVIEMSPWAKTLTKLITWYDVYVQVAIGALFVPRRYYTDLAAHALLLFFILTTYLPAPVFGFGWTLTILGIILAYQRSISLVYWYYAALVAILIYQIPWRDWVLAA